MPFKLDKQLQPTDKQILFARNLVNNGYNAFTQFSPDTERIKLLKKLLAQSKVRANQKIDHNLYPDAKNIARRDIDKSIDPINADIERQGKNAARDHIKDKEYKGIHDEYKNLSTNNIFTTESANPNVGNPYQHFVATGPIGEQGMEFVRFVPKQEWAYMSSNRYHGGKKFTPGYSRKRFKLGGEVPSSNTHTKFKDSMKNRRESTNVVDMRHIKYPNPVLEGIRRVPAIIYQGFTNVNEENIPTILKTPYMKQIHAINKKYGTNLRTLSWGNVKR